jgi:hypothetical protein
MARLILTATCQVHLLLLKPIARHEHRFLLKRTAHPPKKESITVCIVNYSSTRGRRLAQKNPDIGLGYKEETLERKLQQR